MQKTLVILKPDTIKRGLIGKIISRFEKKGLKLVAMKMMQLDDKILKNHYSHLADKPFFPRICSFMKSAPVIVQCWEGKDIIKVVRQLCGVTNAREALPGTIRGDYSMSIQCNIVHASENEAVAKVEIDNFFCSKDLFKYEKSDFDNVYSEDERENV